MLNTIKGIDETTKATVKPTQFIYLAGPYSHDLPSMRENRYLAHKQCLTKMMNEGDKVFAPIVQGHLLDLNHWGGAEWLGFDLPILDRCDLLAVLTIPGWDKSWGVDKEITRAKETNKPIVYLDPKDYVDHKLLEML